MYPFFRRSDMKIFNIPRPIALRDSYVPLRNPFRNCCWRVGPYWRPALSVPVQSKRLLSRPPIRHCLFFLLSFCLFVLLSFCLVAFFVFLSRCIFVFLDFYIKGILFIWLPSSFSAKLKESCHISSYYSYHSKFIFLKHEKRKAWTSKTKYCHFSLYQAWRTGRVRRARTPGRI